MIMKILLIEDEVKTVNALKQGLEENGCIVDVAYDGDMGLKLAARGDYAVIISDVILPQINGIEMLRQLRNLEVRTPVILLTALDQTDDKVQGFEEGADDYVVKPFEFKELLARTRALARRAHLVAPENRPNLLTFADVVLNFDTVECTRSGKKINLTPREFAFMEYLIRNQGRAVSKSEIAGKVWDIHFDTGTNVVEVYVNYLRNKIDKPFDNKLIHTVFGTGYILKEEV
jgi:two-component system, OmpR family, copper resistance phosphate regulon response regulator CusR